MYWHLSPPLRKISFLLARALVIEPCQTAQNQHVRLGKIPIGMHDQAGRSTGADERIGGEVAVT